MMRWAFVIFILVFNLGISSTSIAETTIDWEVENSFRMFLDPEHTKLHRNEYEKLSDSEKKSPILSIERRLANQFPQGWASKAYETTCWDSKKNRYHTCRGKKKDYLHPKSHKIIASLISDASLSGRCQWQLFKSKKYKKSISSKIVKSCSEHVGIKVPYPSGGYLLVKKDNKILAKSRVKVKDLFIVGLGDSFGSGEGNPDRPVALSDDRDAHYGRVKKGVKLKHYPTRTGTWFWIGDSLFSKKRAKWSSRPCHRSLYSHQLRVALQLATENKQRAVTFAGFACSGAQIIVGLMDRYLGNEWVRHSPDTSQIGSAARASCGPNEAEFRTYTTTFTYGGKLENLENLGLYNCNRKKKRKIDLLLVSIGGNDVGFSRLVANAILNDETALKKLGGWVGQIYRSKDAAKKIDELKLRYKALNRAFHIILNIPWKQADRVILTAYPKMGYMQDGKTICGDGPKGMDLHPVFRVNSARVKDSEKFAGTLFNVMKSTAKKNKWTFVTDHRERFAKHGFCAFDEEKPDDIDELFGIPKKKNDGWDLYNPSEYRPYNSRQRWIRTPNDVFMSVHQHTKRRLIRRFLRAKNLNQFQLIYAGTYGGSFHPTAEGQAVIADAVLLKARAILNKYK